MLAVEPLHQPRIVESVMADQVGPHPGQRRADGCGVGGANALADAGDALVGLDLDQHQLGALHRAVGPMVGLPVGQEERCRADVRDAQAATLSIDDVVATVDVEGLARQELGGISREVGRREADVLDRDQALHRCLGLGLVQQLVELGDA